MSKKLTENEYREIVTRKCVFNESKEAICEALNLSEKTVRNVLKAFNLVKGGSVAELERAVEFDSVTPDMVMWAARRLDMRIPADKIEAAYKRKCDKRRAKKEWNAAFHEIENDATVDRSVTVVKEEEEKNDALYFIKILEALNRQNELMEQLLDVVIPKYVSDVKDNLNANSDVICERLKNCEQSLEKIVCNTRKRGM